MQVTLSNDSYDPWQELADLNLEIEVCSDMPPGLLGEYDHDFLLVRLREGMPTRQLNSVLAHELSHARHGDVRTDCRRVNLRQEQRADREAALRMVGVDALASALAVHDRLSAIAVELRVSDDLLRTRLQLLTQEERQLLARREKRRGRVA